MKRGWPVGACAVTVLFGVAGGEVVRRDGSRVAAPVEGVSLAGVTIGGDEPRVIGWQSVLRVDGDLADEAAAYEGIADAAWRARQRLARRDVAMAAVEFDRLWALFAGAEDADGPTALAVAEGAMATRIAQRRAVEAVGPYLEAVRLRAADVRLAGEPTARAVRSPLDEATLLVPELPPMFSAPEVVTSFDVETGDARAGVLAQLYAAAIVAELGEEVELPDRAVVGDDRALQLVWHIVRARVGDATEREASRAFLEGDLRRVDEPWEEAWRRAGIGRSLLMEEDAARRMAGVLELLHIPARFERSQPLLTLVALADVAAELERTGDQRGADRLLEQRERLLVHPEVDLALPPLDAPGRESEDGGQPVEEAS